MSLGATEGLGTKLGFVHKKLKKIGSWTAESNKPSDCNVVIQFPKDALPNTIHWLSNAITKSATGLIINICRHERTGLTNMLVSCSFKGLLKGAEEILLKKKLKKEHGGQLRDFFLEDSGMYEDVERPMLFFTNQERQQIVLHLINNVRLDRTDKVQGHVMVEGQAIVPRMVTTHMVKQIYPLHSHADLEELRKNWVFNFTSFQPLDKIKDYFGVHIGMYFAFLGHYTMALTVPTFLGIFIWLSSGHSQEQDDRYFVMFALVNVVWSTIYIEMWKRREAEQAFKWGTLDKQDDLITEPRPLYTGDLIVSPVTGRLEPHYSRWKRNLFYYTVSVPVMVLCHCVIVLVCVNFFAFYDIIKARIDSGELYFIFKFAPSMFLAGSVMIMDRVYGTIAVWLNDKENYRSDEEYKNQLIVKLMVFQSVNSFLSLFYTAFYIQDFNRLRNQLAILFVVRQVVGNMKESLLSFFISKSKQQLGAVGATTNIEIIKQIRNDCVSTVKQHHQARHRNQLSSESTEGVPSDEHLTINSIHVTDITSLETDTTSLETDTQTNITDNQSTVTDSPCTVTDSESVASDNQIITNEGIRYRSAANTDKTNSDTLEVEQQTTEGFQISNSSGEEGDSNVCPVRKLTQAESEGLMPKYDGTFEDYLEMVIQFSYVSWFSSVFPLAGFFALLNNVIEIRSDAFKISMSYQRPFGERVRNIGAWKTVLEVMSLGTIIVNTALIGISGPMQRLFPDLSTTQRLLLIVIMEHVVLAIKFIIRMAIAEVPEWVSIEMAKLEFSRREALRLRLQEQLTESNTSKMLETHSGVSTARNSPYKEMMHTRWETPTFYITNADSPGLEENARCAADDEDIIVAHYN